MVAIRHQDEDLEMPKARAKLEDGIIADFAKWIEMGAPDPRDRPSSEEEVAKDTDWAAVMERRKSWWSFQAIEKPALPEGGRPTGWTASPRRAWRRQGWRRPPRPTAPP